MVKRERHQLFGGVFTVVTLVLLLAAPEANAQGKDTLALRTIPQSVLDALTARFPKAEIHTWTRETEDDIEIYDIEFTQEGRKFEADIKEDGGIHNWERAIALKDLPDPAREAVETKYPKATFKELMEITDVKKGRESLYGYEIVLKTASGEDVEVTVSAGGEILEDSGEGK